MTREGVPARLPSQFLFTALSVGLLIYPGVHPVPRGTLYMLFSTVPQLAEPISM